MSDRPVAVAGAAAKATAPADPLLRVDGIEVVYQRSVLALQNVSLEVRPGQVVTLLGSNGAGKTTVMRAISGLLPIHDGHITKGSVTYAGSKVTDAESAAIVRLGIGQVLEGRRVFQQLSVEDNLRVGGIRQRRGDYAAHLDRVYQLFPNLKDRRRVHGGFLSGGEQQMLAIGRALMSNPRLLLMDEPSLGLAPIVVALLQDVIRQINEDGTAILLVEQNAHLALTVAHHGYVLELGRIVADKPRDQLLADQDIQEFYLGMEVGGARRRFAEVKHYRRRKRWN